MKRRYRRNVSWMILVVLAEKHIHPLIHFSKHRGLQFIFHDL